MKTNHLLKNTSLKRHRLSLAALGCVFLSLTALGARADTTVYSNDFTNGAGPEWSNNTTATSNGEMFLGASANGFGNGTDTLSLAALPAHDTVTIAFDLYIIQSWDGNGETSGGPDNYTLAQNGLSLLLTNFCNATRGETQAYSAATPNGLGAMNPPRSGDFEAGHLGFGTGDFGDTTYRFSLTFSSTANALAFDFTSLQNQGPGDEGWGLDNVSVSVVPEPSTWVMLAVGIALLCGLMRYRARLNGCDLCLNLTNK